MPPHSTDYPIETQPEIATNGAHKGQSQLKQSDNYGLTIVQSSLSLLGHILIGATVAFCLVFSFRGGIPLNATSLHVVLCVIGYQLLMGEAILSLSPSNGWSASLRFVDKRRAHWVLQLLGCGLAIGGSFHKILDKDIHWNSLHGQFALVALVFTSVSLVNGLASLYAYELRGKLPGNISKLSHVCFGTVAFVTSSITLCYGFDKVNFRAWSTDALANTFISFVAIFTFIIIVNPLITFYNKSKALIGK